MNLDLTHPDGLLDFLWRTVTAYRPVVTVGERWKVVDADGDLFAFRDDPREVSGPFPDLAATVRRLGRRRHRRPRFGDPRIEVMEWDGGFWHVSAGLVTWFASLERAVAHRIPVAFQWIRGSEGLLLHREEWERCHAIHRLLDSAMEETTSWHELRLALPADEFGRLPLWARNGGEMEYREAGRRYFFDPRIDPEAVDDALVIRAEDPVDPLRIPGFEDADYPPWFFESERLRLPASFVRRFGTRTGSPAVGPWTAYPEARVDEMREALAKEGFDLQVVCGRSAWVEGADPSVDVGVGVGAGAGSEGRAEP